MKLIFEVAGDKLIERDLLRISGRTIKAKPAFDAIGGLMIEETRIQFASEGHHASGGWKPLKDATLAEKRLHGFRPEILRRTDALLDSLTVRGDTHMIFEATESGLTFGSKLRYAGVHQNPRPGNPLPRRRPLEFTEATKNRCVKILQAYLFTGEVYA